MITRNTSTPQYIILVALVVSTISLVGIGIQSVSGTSDDWPDDECKVVEPGTHSGTIITPDDSDILGVTLDRGESATLAVQIGYHVSTRISLLGDGQDSSVDPRENAVSSPAEGPFHEDIARFLDFDDTNQSTASWIVWAEESGDFCFQLRGGPPDGFEPSQWKMDISVDDPEPADLPDRTEIDQLESEIATLKEDLEAKQDQIDSLQTQLDDATATIEITVQPGDGFDSYVSDGSAVVSVTSDPDVVDDVEIEFRGESVTLDDGMASISLPDPGEYELSVSYGGVMQSETISVQEYQRANGDADDHTDGETEGDSTGDADLDDPGADDDGTGFGLLIALIALAGWGVSRSRPGFPFEQAWSVTPWDGRF